MAFNLDVFESSLKNGLSAWTADYKSRRPTFLEAAAVAGLGSPNEAVRRHLNDLNDGPWRSSKKRAEGMKPLAVELAKADSVAPAVFGDLVRAGLRKHVAPLALLWMAQKARTDNADAWVRFACKLEDGVDVDAEEVVASLGAADLNPYYNVGDAVATTLRAQVGGALQHPTAIVWAMHRTAEASSFTVETMLLLVADITVNALQGGASRGS